MIILALPWVAHKTQFVFNLPLTSYTNTVANFNVKEYVNYFSNFVRPCDFVCVVKCINWPKTNV